MPPHAIEILLVEDNPGDARFLQETLKDCRLQNVLHVVTDGDEALDFLRKTGRHKGAPTPDLVLLDVNLPKVDGPEVLRQMELDPALREIAVVVLVASATDALLMGLNGLGSRCLASKPLTPERLLDTIRQVPQLGLTIVRIAAIGS